MLDRIVDADRRVVVGQQIAQQLRDQARLLVDGDRRAALLAALPHVDPDLVEVIQVGEDVFLRSARRRGADDHAAAEAVLLAEFLDDAAQARALVAAVDLARDADVIDGRHEDQEAAGQRDVTGQARALRAERLLRHLDDDVLPFLQQLFDLRLGRPFLLVAIAGRRDRGLAAAPFRRRRRALGDRTVGTFGTRTIGTVGTLAPLAPVVVIVVLVVLVEIGDDVRDVEEAVALEADVDERRLHAGQDFRDPALVNVTDDAAVLFALDE